MIVALATKTAEILKNNKRFERLRYLRQNKWAKIAKIAKEKHNRKCLMIAADVIRPAAIEQLQGIAHGMPQYAADVVGLGLG